MEDEDFDADATNLNFQLPNYMIPSPLIEQVVDIFKEVRQRKSISEQDIRDYLNGSKDWKVESAVKGSVTRALLRHVLSGVDEVEVLNPMNEENIVIQILSFL